MHNKEIYKAKRIYLQGVVDNPITVDELPDRKKKIIQISPIKLVFRHVEKTGQLILERMEFTL